MFVTLRVAGLWIQTHLTAKAVSSMAARMGKESLNMGNSNLFCSVLPIPFCSLSCFLQDKIIHLIKNLVHPYIIVTFISLPLHPDSGLFSLAWLLNKLSCFVILKLMIKQFFLQESMLCITLKWAQGFPFLVSLSVHLYFPEYYFQCRALGEEADSKTDRLCSELVPETFHHALQKELCNSHMHSALFPIFCRSLPPLKNSSCTS